MKMKKLLLSWMIGMLGCVGAVAAEKEKRDFEVGVYGGVTLSDEIAWTVEPSVTWQFHKYVGVGAGLAMTHQYNESDRQTVIDGYPSILVNSQIGAGWFLFKPYLVLRSPCIWSNNDGEVQLRVVLQPGVTLGCPFHNSLTYRLERIENNVGTTVGYRRFGNRGLEIFYWNVRAALNLQIGDVVVGLGYEASNLDYYSSRRNVILQNGSKFQVPERMLHQNIFLMLGYRF